MSMQQPDSRGYLDVLFSLLYHSFVSFVILKLFYLLNNQIIDEGFVSFYRPEN